MFAANSVLVGVPAAVRLRTRVCRKTDRASCPGNRRATVLRRPIKAYAASSARPISSLNKRLRSANVGIMPPLRYGIARPDRPPSTRWRWIALSRDTPIRRPFAVTCNRIAYFRVAATHGDSCYPRERPERGKPDIDARFGSSSPTRRWAKSEEQHVNSQQGHGSWVMSRCLTASCNTARKSWGVSDISSTSRPAKNERIRASSRPTGVSRRAASRSAIVRRGLTEISPSNHT